MNSLQIVRTVAELRKTVENWRAAGLRVALVPTMGALHKGHLSLVEAARARADRVVATIFVNPKQFGPNEDLSRYPRQEAKDAEMLQTAGCDVLFLPAVAEMYPEGFATNISVSGVSSGLCGDDRPGHFDGVATVVTKLLNMARPDIAIFGEKDYQQLAVIRRFVTDLNMGIEIIGAPIVREADGLAMSSRNAYLSQEQRAIASALPHVLAQVRDQIAGGADVAAAIRSGTQEILAAGFDTVDYLELRDARSLTPMTALDREARLFVAARLGATRLIDNLAVQPLPG